MDRKRRMKKHSLVKVFLFVFIPLLIVSVLWFGYAHFKASRLGDIEEVLPESNELEKLEEAEEKIKEEILNKLSK